MAPQIEHHELFSVPVFQIRDLPDFPEHQQPLIDLALRMRAEQPGVKYSNRDGYHSESTLHASGNPHISWLVGQVMDIARELEEHCNGRHTGLPAIEGMWVNVHPQGGYNAPHSHPPDHWSGVLYVHAEAAGADEANEDAAGHISLLNPSPAGIQFGMLPHAQFAPEDGMIVMFPGWLTHMVHPHRSNEDRISIAFNVGFNPFVPDPRRVR